MHSFKYIRSVLATLLTSFSMVINLEELCRKLLDTLERNKREKRPEFQAM